MQVEKDKEQIITRWFLKTKLTNRRDRDDSLLVPYQVLKLRRKGNHIDLFISCSFKNSNISAYCNKKDTQRNIYQRILGQTLI